MSHALPNFKCLLPAALIACLAGAAPSKSTEGNESNQLDHSEVALVRQVVHNEIEAQLHDNSLWCHREQRQEDGKAARTLEVCQTVDGDLERVMAVNGRELSAEQRLAEDDRIQKVISHPEQLRSKQKKEREDGEQQRNLFRNLPEAFEFRRESEAGDLVTLSFRPNAAFRASTRAAMVFHHLEGTMVVDAKQKRLVEMNGRLTSEVRFGGGLLGHLDKNGTFAVKQQEIGKGHWDLSYMNVHINGKVLFFKTIAVQEKRTLDDYHPLPVDATLQQAAEFLASDFDVHSASLSGK